jgi:hypothetical protein
MVKTSATGGSAMTDSRTSRHAGPLLAAILFSYAPLRALIVGAGAATAGAAVTTAEDTPVETPAPAIAPQSAAAETVIFAKGLAGSFGTRGSQGVETLPENQSRQEDAFGCDFDQAPIAFEE